MHVHMHTCIHEWPSVTLIGTQDAQELVDLRAVHSRVTHSRLAHVC